MKQIIEGRKYLLFRYLKENQNKTNGYPKILFKENCRSIGLTVHFKKESRVLFSSKS